MLFVRSGLVGCVEQMVPLFQFRFHDGVWAALAKSLPLLLDRTQLRWPERLTQMLHDVSNT